MRRGAKVARQGVVGGSRHRGRQSGVDLQGAGGRIGESPGGCGRDSVQGSRGERPRVGPGKSECGGVTWGTRGAVTRGESASKEQFFLLVLFLRLYPVSIIFTQNNNACLNDDQCTTSYYNFLCVSLISQKKNRLVGKG